MTSITSPTIGAFLKLKLQACINVFILIFHNFKSLVLTYLLDIFFNSYYDLLNLEKLASWEQKIDHNRNQGGGKKLKQKASPRYSYAWIVNFMYTGCLYQCFLLSDISYFYYDDERIHGVNRMASFSLELWWCRQGSGNTTLSCDVKLRRWEIFHFGEDLCCTSALEPLFSLLELVLHCIWAQPSGMGIQGGSLGSVVAGLMFAPPSEFAAVSALLVLLLEIKEKLFHHVFFYHASSSFHLYWFYLYPYKTY